jgi:predicted transposase YbfD/YdcC
MKGVAMAQDLDFNGASFLNYFSQLEDPRINRKKLYPLNEIFLVTLAATICGAESWRDLEMYGNQKINFLKQFLPFNNGIPSHDTFARVFSLIDPKSFGLCFTNWVKSIQKEMPEFINIDGKTLRRSFDRANSKSAMHMVSAFASEARLVLAQVKVDEKSNEITAIPDLLNLLAIKGSIITMDAMGTQKSIAKLIIDKDGNYVLALKGNHGNLLDQVKDHFEIEKKNEFNALKHDKHIEYDKGHGRVERRECIVTDAINWIEGIKDWSGIKSIAMAQSTRSIGDKETIEIRYYISSLPANAHLIARAIRAHWSIENSLHWTLDVTLNEDSSRIRVRNAPENIAIIRRIGLNLLQNAKNKDISIKGLRKSAGWSNEVLENILSQNF